MENKNILNNLINGELLISSEVQKEKHNFCLYCGKEITGRFCNVSCQNKYKGLLNRKKYEDNPDLCINCGKPLTLEQHKQKGKFCSHNCSAIHTNKKRGPLSEEHRQNISKSITCIYKQNSTNYILKKRVYTCIVCGNKYNYKKGISTRKCCSKDCSLYLKEHRKDFLSNDALEALSEAGRKSACVQGNNRRSKNEIDFCNLCNEYFSNVDANKTIFNGWDADIIIHEYKLAILWNGPWHYKEIYKKCSLKQIQNRDKIKEQEIIKCGYMPYIIKDMGKANYNFVLQEFNKLIDYIKNIDN